MNLESCIENGWFGSRHMHDLRAAALPFLQFFIGQQPWQGNGALLPFS